MRLDKGFCGSFWVGGIGGFGGVRFALGAKAHLSDDKTVAKMGHPVCLALLE